MSTLVTPSAKSHERVTGRWLRDIHADSRREWFVYYAKSVVGTPIPWLFAAYAALCFMSRAGLEIAAWSCALLTASYIGIDRFSANRELQFFRVGSDFFLLGYLCVGVVGAFLSAHSLVDGLATLGGVRWILLLYLITYCWELFPGLNRMYFLIIGTACLCCVYGLWQHFTGLDLVRGTALDYAPIPGHVYFSINGLFSTPEIFGTLLATLLPFPAAAFVLSDERERFGPKWIALIILMLFSVTLFWTYRPGLWMAGLVGIAVTMLLQGRNYLALISFFFTTFLLVILITYGSPSKMMSGVQAGEFTRAERQRSQINTQVKLWQENTWLGVGRKAVTAADYDPGTGNVYFQLLAQSGVLGLAFYFLFILTYLLSTYTIFSEIPRTHYWHRVLVSGAIAGQIAFHLAGLYWSTLAEAFAVNFFILMISSVSYLSEHYSRGLVPDDHSL
jgi:hypothetical protein